jgi:hypothetical protein
MEIFANIKYFISKYINIFLKEGECFYEQILE